jgi:transglutaminase/protease-like cytokinesis protein 3
MPPTRLRKVGLFVSIIGLACLSDIGARTPTHPGTAARPAPRPPDDRRGHAELELTYTFSATGQTSMVRFTVLLPRTITGRQEISTKCSPNPSRVFTRNGSRYAEFVFPKPKERFKVEVEIKGELSRYDLSTARRKSQNKITEASTLEPFLKHEKNIEKDDPQIRRIAKAMKAQSETGLVKQIYTYVLDNMEYGGFKEKNLGALDALKNNKGDCSEYTALFVALCRAKEIPARVVYGYTSEYKDTPKHAWAEVFLEKHGWVPFDPTRGDQNNRFVRDQLFHTLQPIYIQLADIHTNHVVGKANYYKYWYWGDEVKVKESVKIKQPSGPPRRPR